MTSIENSFQSKQEVKSSNQNTIIECNLCEKQFNNKHGLNLHMTIVHKLLKLKCDSCDKRFRQKRALEKHHLTVHQKIRRFSCEDCGTSFLRNDSFTSVTYWMWILRGKKWNILNRRPEGDSWLFANTRHCSTARWPKSWQNGSPQEAKMLRIAANMNFHVVDYASRGTTYSSLVSRLSENGCKR